MDLIRKKLSHFQVPVCSIFRKKVFSGQVCYEADLNQFKNLFLRQASERLENNLDFNSFKETENDNKFAVMLKTISKISGGPLTTTFS